MARRSIVVLAFALGCEPEAAWFAESSYVMESIEGKGWYGGMRLVFHDDREMSAFAGCNSMQGPYRLIGGTLVAEGLSQTEKGCSPAVLHHQDDWMQQFLAEAPAYEVDGPRLTLRDDVVTIVLLDEEVAIPDRPLVGSVWTIEGLVDGDLVLAWAIEDPGTITFAADGRVAIHGPCAQGAAEYAVDGAVVHLEQVAIASPMCADAEAARSIDQHLRALLIDGPLSYGIDAKRLVLMRGELGLVLRSD